jgi:hypothetical protein
MSQYQAVEDEIFALQKWWVTEMARTLEIDTTSGVRQSGNMVFSLKMGTPSASGSLTMTLDKLDITVDGKNGNTEMLYGGRIGFDVKASDYRYDEVTDEYKKVPTEIKGEVRFGATFIQANGHTYARLDALDVSISGDAMIREELDKALEKSRKYIGKMYKLPWSTSVDLKPENIREIIQKGVQTLQSKPLFSVINKQKDGSYRLRLRADTIKALWLTMRNTNKAIFSYKNLDGKKELRMSPRRNAKNNYVILSELGWVYSLVGKVYEKTKYETTEMNFSMTKDAFLLRAKDKSSTLSAEWRLGQLVVDYQSVATTWSPAHTFRVEGRLLPDMKNIDLTFSYDAKKVGTLSSAVGGDGGVSYRANFSFTDELWSVLLDLNWSYRETKGDYIILPPKIYELLD